MGSNEETKFTWSLGDDSYCESCGDSWNEIGLELWDEEDNTWQLYTRVGCYGGDAVLSTDEDWEAESEEIIKDALTFSNFSKDDAKDLRERLELIKGENK
jgi:hypothetical protein